MAAWIARADEAKLPRVICTECMQDAVLEQHDHYVHVECKGTACGGIQGVVRDYSLSSRATNKSKTLVLEDVSATFLTPTELEHQNVTLVREIFKNVRILGLINRVRISQGHQRLTFEPQEIDPVIDLLLLFRADEKQVATVPLLLAPLLKPENSAVSCIVCNDTGSYENGSVTSRCTCPAANK